MQHFICDCGTGPTSTGRISVLTKKENHVEVGLRLIKLKVVQHDIKYKTLEASRRGVYAHSYNTKKPISSITIFWNEGNPYASLNPQPEAGTIKCPPTLRSKYNYDLHDNYPLKVNVVTGLPEHTLLPAYGKWIVKSNYDPKSEVNITTLWHRLKHMVKNGKLPVIKMECPKGDKTTPPEIHLTTTEAHMTAVGDNIQDIVKYDIHYVVGKCCIYRDK